jgi:UDPglucose 6-dehydrogenase
VSQITGSRVSEFDAPRISGEKTLRISVIGLGYVGLVTSACLAEWGHQITGLDSSETRLSALRAGSMPIAEPGLADMVARNVAAGRLSFAAMDELPAVLATSDIVMVAVGTHDGNGGWQTATMVSALADVARHVADDAALVIRSTLPPAFVAELPALVLELRSEARRRPSPLMLNPEFTREGNAIRDFMEPSRVVIGIAADPTGQGEALLRDVYASAKAPILAMPATDAALAKLGANLFLATKISFANELASLCDVFGADVDRVVESMSYDDRIGGQFLRSGVGFGGSCLPNQVSMMTRSAQAAGLDAKLLHAVEEINHAQRTRFVDRIRDSAGPELAGRRIAILGLTFKPQTDDLRDAPALTIAAELIREGASVVACDPMPAARRLAASLIDGLEVTDDLLEAVRSADVAALVTEWPEYVHADWRRIGEHMRRRAVVDGRNALDRHTLAELGFAYTAFGRGSISGIVDQAEDTSHVVGRAPASTMAGVSAGPGGR